MSSERRHPLRLGTRGSPLALAQAGRVARQLREQCGQPAVLVTIATPGDESTKPVERLGMTGVFTSTLREALLDGAVDLVVHSCKDLPTAPVPGLQVAAYPAREDPRDALVWPGGTSLDALPSGARIGTGSPRRAALLRATGRQLQIVQVRGNVDTRLRKARRRRGRHPRAGDGGTVQARPPRGSRHASRPVAAHARSGVRHAGHRVPHR